MKSMKETVETYNNEVDNLVLCHKNDGGGKARSKSGLAFENFLESVCDVNGLVAKRNDYKKSEIIDGEQLDKLQVDKHCYRDNVLVKMIESKTYLDACYLKRAVDDFIDLHNSPDVPDNLDSNECNNIDDVMNKYQERFLELKKILDGIYDKLIIEYHETELRRLTNGKERKSSVQIDTLNL